VVEVERGMDWKHLLAYITGSVDEDLLLRNAYLITENRLLRQQIPGHMRRIVLPRQSPHPNAYVELWVRSVKEDALSGLILCGERFLRRALQGYVIHYHHERHHQGQRTVILMPTAHHHARADGPVHCRKRLGGLLKYYHGEAA
jgi:hypothetical protein